MITTGDEQAKCDKPAILDGWKPIIFCLPSISTGVGFWNHPQYHGTVFTDGWWVSCSMILPTKSYWRMICPTTVKSEQPIRRLVWVTCWWFNGFTNTKIIKDDLTKWNYSWSHFLSLINHNGGSIKYNQIIYGDVDDSMGDFVGIQWWLQRNGVSTSSEVEKSCDHQAAKSLDLTVYLPNCFSQLEFWNMPLSTMNISSISSRWPQPNKVLHMYQDPGYCVFNPIFPYILCVKFQLFRVQGPLLIPTLRSFPRSRQGAGRWSSCASLGAMGSSYDSPMRLAESGWKWLCLGFHGDTPRPKKTCGVWGGKVLLISIYIYIYGSGVALFFRKPSCSCLGSENGAYPLWIW